MIWLRDYARPALSTQHTCCDAFRVVRQRWAQCERLGPYPAAPRAPRPSAEWAISPGSCPLMGSR